MIQRYAYVGAITALAAIVASAAILAAGQAQPPAPYTVLVGEARSQLPVRTFGRQEMFALDDLVKVFDLSVREDALAGGLTISTKTQTIALTPGQGLASVAGRVISLSAPPARDGRGWYLPVDFVPRALGPALGTRFDLRRPSRLIVGGDLRVPRITTRVEQIPAAVRVTFDVAPETPHTISREANRLVVRFEADVLDAAFAPSPAADLVQAIRHAEAGAAIVLELGPRFASFKAADTAADRGAGRIVIDVASTAEAPVETPTTTAAAPEPPPFLELTPPGLRTIVIDAGHGGDEHGARGPHGTSEKDVTLGVARRLKAAIEVRLGARVILTRDGDQTVGLDERAAVANNNKADLFISLHANASVRPAVTGAEVFYLNLADYGDEAQRLAQGDRERVPVLGGGTRDIEVIRWDTAQARHIADSAVFARLVEASLRSRVPMSARAIQQAPFRVLVGANMPAVLVEMGFITNAEQEKQLTSESFQAAIVQALVDSIVRFRDSGGGRATATTAAPVRGDRS